MKSREIFEEIRSQKDQIFGLKMRLTLFVAAELIVCILISFGAEMLLKNVLTSEWRLPLAVAGLVLGLIICFGITGAISNWFFDPIKQLSKAMERVADGDFSVRLQTKSRLKEIREVGDKLRETTEGNINYTAIAIKGLLFHYKPTDATVTVDGVKHKFKRVWLAPTMNGKFYGGGMMPTPNQDRTGGKLSVMVYHNLGKLKALMVFPSIFKGEHVKHKNNIAILEGSEITVEFDRPTPLQIDGETILGISSYKTKAHYHDMVNA